MNTVTTESVSADPTQTDAIVANIDKQRQCAATLADVKANIATYKRCLQRIEDAALLSGDLDGKNAETRAAQLREILRCNDTYARTQGKLQDAEHSAASLTIQLQYLQNMHAVYYMRAGIPVAVTVRA